MVYPVRNTTNSATITAVEKWILSFEIPQSIIHERGTAFINTEFITCTKELGITLQPRTAHSPWTNLNDAGNNWSSLAPKFAFAHNRNVNYTTGKTPFEILFGTKPQISMSLKLRLYRNKHNFAVQNFVKTSLPILIVRTV